MKITVHEKKAQGRKVVAYRGESGRIYLPTCDHKVVCLTDANIFISSEPIAYMQTHSDAFAPIYEGDLSLTVEA